MSARCGKCLELVDKREDGDWVHTASQRVACGTEPTKGRPPAIEPVDDADLGDG
jgi:uncharacterized protein (DUF342 family)